VLACHSSYRLGVWYGIGTCRVVEVELGVEFKNQ